VLRATALNNALLIVIRQRFRNSPALYKITNGTAIPDFAKEVTLFAPPLRSSPYNP
jgi:hypothetical protein